MDSIATAQDTLSSIWEEKYKNLVQQLGTAPSDWSQQMRLIVVISVFSALMLMAITIALTCCYMRRRNKLRSIREPKSETSSETSDEAGGWLEREQRRPRPAYNNFGYMPDVPDPVHSRIV
ncbi:hypothetical protein CcaCcLH18_08543 [Colletotrichum camelliae]|nr:hypothetical protein CcaCcLH18_08543 [Colletotrichum camelliae]